MTILARIKEAIFGKPRVPDVFHMGGGWGNRIELWTPGKKDGWAKVVGWKTPMPQKGDHLLVPLKSGRVELWVFHGINPCGDPDDMFFATVRFKDATQESEQEAAHE